MVPNTTYDYRFRVVTTDGRAPGARQASHRVDDTRLEWRRLAATASPCGGTMATEPSPSERWASPSSGLASALPTLLGVEDLEPVDFFIYADDRAFREALGPATRENVGGEAHPDIHTLFGLIEPRQVGSDWVEELVVHELAHLVFDEAVAQPLRLPAALAQRGSGRLPARGLRRGRPRPGAAAAGSGSLIPLEGLAGQFPTRADRFALAYAESVSAVTTSSRRHGAGRPGGARDLLRRTARPSTRPSGRPRARGSAAFEDDWLASLGAERPEPHGPLPARAWTCAGGGRASPARRFATLRPPMR